MRARRRATLHAMAVAAAMAALGGCAGGGTEGGGAAAPPPTANADDRVEVTGLDHLAWEPEQLTARSGVIEVVLTCEPRVNHNLVIGSVEVATCRPGETRSGLVELEPGDHEFVCTVPGHSSRMRGTLTVAG